MYATVESDQVDPLCLESLGDTDLLRMVKSGNDDALGTLLRRHREALYRFCLHLMPNRDDAEDICQESLARAMMRLDSLHTGSAFRSWLFSIARNLSIDTYRSRKRLCSLPDEELFPLPLPLRQESPYERVEVHEEYQTVAEALGKLKKNHQSVLMMREVEGLSYADIAARLDVSQSAVETLLFRARKRLREEYGKSSAPAPAFAFLGSLRSVLSRLASPLGGAPLAAKVAVTALIVGGAAVVAPHALPLAPTAHSAASVAQVRPSTNGAVPASVILSGAPHSGRASTSPSRRSTAGARGTGKNATHVSTASNRHRTQRGVSRIVAAGSLRRTRGAGGHHGPSPAGGTPPAVKSRRGATASPVSLGSGVSTARNPVSGALPHRVGTPAAVTPRSSGTVTQPARHVGTAGPSPVAQTQNPVTGAQATVTATTIQAQTAVATTVNQGQATVTGQVQTTTKTVTGVATSTTGQVQNTVHQLPSQGKAAPLPTPTRPPLPAPKVIVPVPTPVVNVPSLPKP